MRLFLNAALLLKWWVYWYPFRIIVQSLPLTALYRIAYAAGPLMRMFAPGKNRRIEAGLQAMFRNGLTASEKRDIIAKTYINNLCGTFEVLHYPFMTKEWCASHVAVEGRENLDAAIKAGRGTVLLHGHFGNAHMIMPVVGHLGYPLSQIASRNPPPPAGGPLASLFNPLRYKIYESKLGYKESLPVNFIYADQSMREALRRFSANEVISIGIDGREGAKCIEVDFLGRKALFYTGVMKLILMAKPTVLPTFHIRQAGGSQKIVIGEPMPLITGAGEDENIAANIKQFVGILEEHVRRYPDHYAKVFLMEAGMFVDQEKP